MFHGLVLTLTVYHYIILVTVEMGIFKPCQTPIVDAFGVKHVMQGTTSPQIHALDTWIQPVLLVQHAQQDSTRVAVAGYHQANAFPAFPALVDNTLFCAVIEC